MSDVVMRCENGMGIPTGSVIPLEGRGNNVIPFDNNCCSILRLRSDWQSWLAEREFELFVTLTYDRNVLPEVARRDLRHFKERLYSKLHGKKVGQYLSFVGFLEFTKQQVPHWHILFEHIRPKLGEPLRQAMERLQYLVKKVWLGMRNTPFSEAGFDSQVVFGQWHLIDYCLKSSVSQRNFDFIEMQHLAGPEAASESLHS